MSTIEEILPGLATSLIIGGIGELTSYSFSTVQGVATVATGSITGGDRSQPTGGNYWIGFRMVLLVRN